ncbi:response regulator [Myxacorys almedinensis]|uniref:Response regulator n=1 Tax=Myxacorys almedinensis A TaxID=2690445 RepID=A0A8J7Z7T3_9CYAN|nr:response regulator [Myxacorys almedinensis]NDJ19511.1 response regulator [Myxacorys almedinensis A]
MVSHRPFQRLQPLSLLAQLISRQVDGCLQVVSESASWLLYLDRGKLAYATNSIAPFDRLYQHLTQLSNQAPALSRLDYAQLRRQFESQPTSPASSSADYQAICWLIEQHYLTPPQATGLIDAIAKDALQPFLTITEGMYELTAKTAIAHYPNLCQLDLRQIVEHCHTRAPRASSRPEPRGATMPRPAVPTGAGAPTEPKSRHTIACIDDSPTILQAISSFLNDSGVAVVMINDPVKALMQIMRTKPDIILLDVGMPNLDGYELCSLLRRHPSFKQTPIVMVTGHTGFIDRAKAKLVGASGYLTKPFTQPELVSTVFKFLGIKDES